ncbi:LuxR C-terminal-related transcriptional regulator [[Empedobacter] haloabium]|uniref:LuxR C-terminal-related transcriptional regulator n=1 Tax=[Empedobacter] haloabium TaxID=592317 RepID=A0ABZ1UGT3_9BURK
MGTIMAYPPATRRPIQLNRAITLTPREREVLQQVAEGNSCKTIARRLGISEYTVKKHRASLLAKLGLRNGIELTRCALAKGGRREARGPPHPTTRWTA